MKPYVEIPDCVYYDSVTVYVYIMKKQINSLTLNQTLLYSNLDLLDITDPVTYDMINLILVRMNI